MFNSPLTVVPASHLPSMGRLGWEVVADEAEEAGTVPLGSCCIGSLVLQEEETPREEIAFPRYTPCSGVQ